jgi:hypothetical protein
MLFRRKIIDLQAGANSLNKAAYRPMVIIILSAVAAAATCGIGPVRLFNE